MMHYMLNHMLCVFGVRFNLSHVNTSKQLQYVCCGKTITKIRFNSPLAHVSCLPRAVQMYNCKIETIKIHYNDILGVHKLSIAEDFTTHILLEEK